MSQEQHPNFHVVKFAAQIMSAYYNSLRGGASTDNVPDISDAVMEFVCAVEDRVNAAVASTNVDPAAGSSDDEPKTLAEAIQEDDRRDDAWCLPPDMGAQ